jgi:hypothetical protein
MIVGPNWKPRVYTDAELNRLEHSGQGTLEDFSAVICRVIKRMSNEEKKELRDTWLAKCDRSSLRLTGDDIRFLKENKIDPDGDD